MTVGTRRVRSLSNRFGRFAQLKFLGRSSRPKGPHASRSLASLTHSFVQGPTEPPLIHSTLSSYFTNEILAKHSNQPALISRSEKPRTHGGPYTLARNLGGVERHLAWDFEEFERHIDSLAKGLVGLGVQTGDRVGVVMGNNR